MKVHVYEGKNIEDLMEKALTELNVKEEDIITKTSEEEGGLFKGKKNKLDVLVKNEVIEYVKEQIKDITEKMGIQVNLEIKKRENFIKINLFSDKNAILIGKGGKTIEALQMILKHSIYNKTGVYVNIIMDVEDYKEKQQKHIEILARRIAKEVATTGVEAKLDNMNSFERRLVHEILAEFKGVQTVSEGEEPNRHIVIKPSEK